MIRTAALPATNRRTSSRKWLRRNLVWSYLRLRALQNGYSRDSLQRIRKYLDYKFGLDVSGAIFEDQQPDAMLPGLTTRAVWDPSEFAWVRHLEDHAPAIRDELIALRRSSRLVPHPQKLVDAGAWNTFHLYSYGMRYDENCELCPATAAALEGCPGMNLSEQGQAYFSVMAEGTHVNAHFGPTNAKLRCHLGLIVPDSSLLRVSDQYLHWQESKCIVFDDSFEHEVWNPDAERAVLIVDFWHPEVTSAEQWAISEMAAFSSRNRRYRDRMRKNSRAMAAARQT